MDCVTICVDVVGVTIINLLKQANQLHDRHMKNIEKK